MNPRNENGFTLIEAIMASLILVIGMGIIGSITSGIIRKYFYSQSHTQAVILAQNKIEELLNRGYTSADLDEGEYENSLNPVNATGDSAGIFYQFWKVEDVKPIPQSKYITSTIQWQDREGASHTVVLTSVCIDQSN
ncbi:MAG: type IV pilus modification PilV family protein [Candidatus Latescibacterota bacterium]